MGSVGCESSVVTQVSIGGFGNHVTGEDLMRFLEEEVGSVYRCRLKTSWTPPESYPDFEIDNLSGIETSDDYQKVQPHAFVHFVSPESVSLALDAAGRCELFLSNEPLKVTVGPENPFRLNQRRRTTIPFKFSNIIVNIGTLFSPDLYFVAWRGPTSGVDFVVDPLDGTCKFCFTRDTAFSFKGNINKHAVIKCDYKVEFLVRDINEIKRYRDKLGSGSVILLQFASSPLIWYRTAAAADDDIVKTVPVDLLDDDDPWIRTTDFTTSGAIGRCNTYKVSIPPSYDAKLEEVMNYFRERRVAEVNFNLPLKIRDEPNFGIHKPEPFYSVHYKEEEIPFEILFLVNAVIHNGIFNHHQLSESFFDLLKTQAKEVSVAALKHICNYRRPVFDAYRKLKLVQEWLLKNPELFKISKQLDDIVEIRRLIITPTKAYCMPPNVELSNRVLRQFKEIADRFLRVTFMDEGLQTINPHVLTHYVAPIVKQITSNSVPLQKTKIFDRVKTICSDGFYLCGRKYSFLAYSSNQLKDRSAWFFAEDRKIGVLQIKNWMGKFTDRNVAKCAARMGQCFSSTYATVEVLPAEVDNELPDIERHGYVFSDGIGKITPDLAMEVAEKLKLDLNRPCAYQIRYAGFKGVVACWPSKGDGIRLSLRPSMNKFQSNHTTLEICSWTRFQPGFLNRQIITLLSTLGVPDEIFWIMQETMVSKLNQMLSDTEVAFDVLTTSCAGEGNAAAIMLSAGFKPEAEPHLRGMLTCIRAGQLWGLREKTKIFVPSGRCLMGCLDEIAVLEQGQCFIQVSVPSLENCFSEHGSCFTETKKNLVVVEGYVVIAKNPCLHPGDVRILKAVNVPGLQHLYDCLVFPQKGERPHANEASGSDLDGDLYFVTWDEHLIPPSKKSWNAMHYTPAVAKTLPRQVLRKDIIDFFVNNMAHETLGAICNAHVVHADSSDRGALDENCISLAELAATAVDFPKTGKIVSMPSKLKPKLYPDFMGKEEYQSYKSNKILGRLYRNIKDGSYHEDDMEKSSDQAVTLNDIYYDAELVVPGSEDFLPEAWNRKCSYDGQLRELLGQYKVKREEEVVTGSIWSMPKSNSRKQGEIKGKLKHSYSTLKKEFRQFFEEMMNPDFELLPDAEKKELYERKASAWYQVTYDPEWLRKAMDLQEPDAPGNVVTLLSFAWIAADHLARIKIKQRRGREEKIDSTTKPIINSLARFLPERMLWGMKLLQASLRGCASHFGL